MSRRRVVVTGLGIVSPVGIGVAERGRRSSRARSGIAPHHALRRVGASRRGSPARSRTSTSRSTCRRKEARRYDTFIHYGLVATMEAIKDAGLDGYAGDKERVGVCIGSGIGGLPMIEDTHDALPRRAACARSRRSSCRARSST